MKSNDNPAHAGTRGICAKSLRDSPWLTGPSFLRTFDWPYVPPTDVKFKLKEKTPGLREPDHTTLETETALSTTNSRPHHINSRVAEEQLIRETPARCCLRFVFTAENGTYRSVSCSITDPQELESAQCRLFYLVQHESFLTEKKSLLKGSSLNSTSKIFQVSPFTGPQGLLRVTGPTKQLEVSNFEANHTVLLDSRHPVIRFLIEHLHQAHCHQGTDYFRSLVQQ